MKRAPRLLTHLDTEHDEPFAPPPWLRSGHVQSILASAPWRRLPLRVRQAPLVKDAQDVLLENNGVKLLGHYHAPADENQCRGIVTTLHGWEGSAKSTYILRATGQLLERGYAVFRLNFRDHGDTHHLNEALFHSCRLDEVVDAIADVGQRYPWPLSLLGYSLGGNFALRVAKQAATRNLDVRRVVAVCPLICPANGMDALDSAPGVYRHYFMRKWRRSLKHKQMLYPDTVRVDEWMSLGMRDLTVKLVEEYTEFDSIEAYLQGYSIAGSYLRDLTIPSTILAAADDPVIPVADVHALPREPNLRVKVFAGGGHCGFVDRLIAPSWLERTILRELEKDVVTPQKTVHS